MDSEYVHSEQVRLDCIGLTVPRESTAELSNEGDDEEAAVVPMNRFVAALKDGAVDTEQHRNGHEMSLL